MKHILLDWFDNDSLKLFIEEVDKSNWDNITVFLDSNGWDMVIYEMYLHILNSNADRFTLVAWYIGSAAFLLFYNAKCRRIVLDNSYAIIHTPAWCTDIWERWVPRGDYHKFRLETMKKQESDISYLSKKEKKDYLDGKDIYIDSERLKKICSIQ